MSPSDPTTKATGLINGTARKRREERRTQSNGSVSTSTPMARPRRKLSGTQDEIPPVVSRQPISGMATPRRSSGRRSLANSISSESWVGRRFDIALPATGAEIRLPALPIIQGDWRFLSGVVVVIFALFSYFFIFSPIFQVEVVDYRGLERLSPSDIAPVIDAMGKPVVAVSPDRLRDRILTAFPDISTAEVKVILPAKISITLTERQPILIWNDGNTERWVDAEGVVFPIRGELAFEASETITGTVTALITLKAQNLPMPADALENALATATSGSPEASLLAAAAALNLNGPRQIDPALVSSVQTLSAFLPTDTALVYTSQHGLGWRDPGGWDVYFGARFDANASADLDQKQLVYEEIARYLKANGLKPVLVSVENVHAPYYRMER